MAVLTAKQRHAHTGAAKKFALPGERYPIGDRAHAGNAKARATQQLAAGNLTPAEASTVKHKANVVLGETDSTHHSVGKRK
jgi:hypothetical protein